MNRKTDRRMEKASTRDADLKKLSNGQKKRVKKKGMKERKRKQRKNERERKKEKEKKERKEGRGDGWYTFYF